MRGRQIRAIKALCLALAVVFSAAAVAEDAAPAAPTAAAPSQVQQHIQELDEITVRGKRLQQTVEDAEDEFYRLYNKAEKDQRYQVSCAFLSADPGPPPSAIMTRVCLPGFVSDAMADWAVWAGRCDPPEPGQGFDEFDCLDRNRDGRLSFDEASARTELGSQFYSLDSDHDSYLSREEFAKRGPSGPPAYRPPQPQLVLMEGSKRWTDHMMQVINADPHLQQMAGHLTDLYGELAAAQQQYGKAREVVDKDNPRKVAKTNPGPRVN